MRGFAPLAGKFAIADTFSGLFELPVFPCACMRVLSMPERLPTPSVSSGQGLVLPVGESCGFVSAESVLTCLCVCPAMFACAAKPCVCICMFGMPARLLGSTWSCLPASRQVLHLRRVSRCADAFRRVRSCIRAISKAWHVLVFAQRVQPVSRVIRPSPIRPRISST